MTMDILWAISHPPVQTTESNIFSSTIAATGTSSVLTPLAADGGWDAYTDFVGGVQFWGYGLVSGSGDGAVRTWDSEYHSCTFFCCADISYECVLVRHTVHCRDIPGL